MGEQANTTTNAENRKAVTAVSAQQALHLTSVLTDMISRHLLEQDAIAGNPKWTALAYEARGRLTALHDAITESQKAPSSTPTAPDDDALPEPLDPAVKG